MVADANQKCLFENKKGKDNKDKRIFISFISSLVEVSKSYINKNNNIVLTKMTI